MFHGHFWVIIKRMYIYKNVILFLKTQELTIAMDQ